MKEVAGNSALLVDPNNVEEIRSAIQQLIKDTHLYEELVAKGKENILKYDCNKIASDYLSVYNELARG